MVSGFQCAISSLSVMEVNCRVGSKMRSLKIAFCCILETQGVKEKLHFHTKEQMPLISLYMKQIAAYTLIAILIGLPFFSCGAISYMFFSSRTDLRWTILERSDKMRALPNSRSEQHNIGLRTVLILAVAEKKRSAQSIRIKNGRRSSTQKAHSKRRTSARVQACSQMQTKKTALAKAELQRKIFEGSTINFGEHIGTCLELDLSDWKPIF